MQADFERLLREVHELREVNRDFQTILDSAYDVIYVSNGEGVTLRVGSASERIFGLKPAQLVGRNVKDLEREGVFRPSATVRALDTRKPVNLIQQTKAGKRLMVYSTPIFDESGKIVRVVNVSKDITEVSQLRHQLKEALALVERYRRELAGLQWERLQAERIVVRSPKMKEVMDIVQKVAQVDSTVLILGESGAGKEVIAKTIHQLSSRSKEPFIAINCGAIPESLLESELFGYERGAFTGARNEGKAGLIESAQGGTLFLDEISELPLPLQVKLLRVLQDKQIVRVGGVKSIDVDIRIISASNKDLMPLVESGQFRKDLYYRLNVIPITVPPLRERKEEIPVLVHLFLERFGEKYGKTKQVSPAAMEALVSYSWPGNVRELENLIERLLVTTDQEVIDIQHLPEVIRSTPIIGSPGLFEEPLKTTLQKVEYEIISRAYDYYRNTYLVAKVLGISQSTVVRKLQRGLPVRFNGKMNSQIQK